VKKEFDVVCIHERKYQQNGEIALSIQVKIAAYQSFICRF